MIILLYVLTINVCMFMPNKDKVILFIVYSFIMSLFVSIRTHFCIELQYCNLRIHTHNSETINYHYKEDT